MMVNKAWMPLLQRWRPWTEADPRLRDADRAEKLARLAESFGNRRELSDSIGNLIQRRSCSTATRPHEGANYHIKMIYCTAYYALYYTTVHSMQYSSTTILYAVKTIHYILLTIKNSTLWEYRCMQNEICIVREFSVCMMKCMNGLQRLSKKLSIQQGTPVQIQFCVKMCSSQCKVKSRALHCGIQYLTQCALDATAHAES